MSTIDNKEIKGLTNKILIGIIGCTITITATLVGIYNNMKYEIRLIREMQNNRKIEVDLQLKSINEKVDDVKEDIKDLKRYK